MDKNRYFSTIEEFNEDNPAAKMMRIALKELYPQKGNLFAFFISIGLGLFFAILVGFSLNTVNILLTIVGIFLSTLLAIFGCIFAVYSILLAFLSDDYIKKLAKIDYKDGVSYLKKGLTYFESVLFLYFIGFAITGVILVFLNCISNDFFVFSNNTMNNILATILLVIYFAFVFRVFYELKSIIYNTIVMFRASITYKLLDFINNHKEDENDDRNY